LLQNLPVIALLATPLRAVQCVRPSGIKGLIADRADTRPLRDIAASPICEFILDGIDRHNKGEGDIPLAACKVCAKFMVVERPGRKMYCSKNCGVKDFYAKRGGAKMYMRDLRQNPMFKKKQKK